MEGSAAAVRGLIGSEYAGQCTEELPEQPASSNPRDRLKTLVQMIVVTPEQKYTFIVDSFSSRRWEWLVFFTVRLRAASELARGWKDDEAA